MYWQNALFDTIRYLPITLGVYVERQRARGHM